MNLYIFGAICIIIVILIALVLAFKDNIKIGSKTNHSLIAGDLDDSEIGLSKALNNLKIYNSVTEEFDY